MTTLAKQLPREKGLQDIDQTVLTPLVRQALNSDYTEIIDWTYEPVYGGASDKGKGLSGIYRFAGTGHDQGRTITWSLILKVVGASAPAGDPQGNTREPLAYQSGVLNDLSGSLVAARCFDVVKREEGVYWVWLEEIVDGKGTEWSLDQYGVAAQHLGQFNGTYLTTEPQPSWPWLSRDWVRNIIEPNASAIAQLEDVLDHPLVSRRYPADVAAGTFRLWEEREIFLAALDRLPQTFCHLDAWNRNLFIRQDGNGREQTVAIDWAFTGLGAIGEEIGPLIQTRNAFVQAEAQALDAIAYSGYLDGLRDAGWEGDPQSVRFGYTASSALRYGLGFIAGGLDTLLNFDESKAVYIKQTFDGRTIEEVADLWAGFMRKLLDLADEARELLDVIE